MEVAEHLPGDMPVAGRLELPAAAGGSVVAEHRPGSSPPSMLTDTLKRSMLAALMVRGQCGLGAARHDERLRPGAA